MIRTVLRGPIICVLICLAGCAKPLVGDWRSIEPAEVPPEIPRIRQVTFEGNGQFRARMLQQYRLSSVAGTYQFSGDKLVLLPAGGANPGQYDYAVRSVGNVLVLTQNNRTYRLCREANPSSATQPLPPVLEGPITGPATQSATTQPSKETPRTKR